VEVLVKQHLLALAADQLAKHADRGICGRSLIVAFATPPRRDKLRLVGVRPPAPVRAAIAVSAVMPWK